MDDLDKREAFLKAIFDAPDDDLPRLVFADWLDERGESAWAELIRRDCLPVATTGNEAPPPPTDRGFRLAHEIAVSAQLLSEPDSFRHAALTDQPEWYGVTTLRVTSGLIASSKPIHTILTSPVTWKVIRLDLSGAEVPAPATDYDSSDADPRTGEFNLRDFTIRPTVTLQAVEALVNARECRRVTHLDLRNNDLDNDAARAIIRSTNLIRLKSLHLREGNQLHGRTWAHLLERFGEDTLQ